MLIMQQFSEAFKLRSLRMLVWMCFWFSSEVVALLGCCGLNDMLHS